MKFLQTTKKIIALSTLLILAPSSVQAWGWKDVLNTNVGCAVLAVTTVFFGYKYFSKPKANHPEKTGFTISDTDKLPALKINAENRGLDRNAGSQSNPNMLSVHGSPAHASDQQSARFTPTPSERIPGQNGASSESSPEITPRIKPEAFAALEKENASLNKQLSDANFKYEQNLKKWKKTNADLAKLRSEEQTKYSEEKQKQEQSITTYEDAANMIRQHSATQAIEITSLQKKLDENTRILNDIEQRRANRKEMATQTEEQPIDPKELQKIETARSLTKEISIWLLGTYTSSETDRQKAIKEATDLLKRRDTILGKEKLNIVSNDNRDYKHSAEFATSAAITISPIFNKNSTFEIAEFNELHVKAEELRSELLKLTMMDTIPSAWQKFGQNVSHAIDKTDKYIKKHDEYWEPGTPLHTAGISFISTCQKARSFRLSDPITYARSVYNNFDSALKNAKNTAEPIADEFEAAMLKGGLSPIADSLEANLYESEQFAAMQSKSARNDNMDHKYAQADKKEDSETDSSDDILTADLDITANFEDESPKISAQTASTSHAPQTSSWFSRYNPLARLWAAQKQITPTITKYSKLNDPKKRASMSKSDVRKIKRRIKKQEKKLTQAQN